MARPDLTRYLVTVRIDECRTRDLAITAPSAYSAGWLCRQLHPGLRILAIRYAERKSDD